MSKREPKWYIENKLKPPKAFFDWCYSKIHTYKWSNKSKAISTPERKGCYVIEKRLTKRSRLTFFDKYYSFAIILVTSKRIEIQSYGFWSSFKDGKQTIKMELTNFEQYANDEIVKIGKHYKGYDFGLVANYSGMGGAYTYTEWYRNNWEERIKKYSELQYIKFKKKIEPWELSHFYNYKFEIEFLQKINAKVLADEVQYPTYASNDGWSYGKNVDMRTITPKWLKENKTQLKNSCHSFMTYELKRRIEIRNGKVVPGIEKYLDYRAINKIPKAVGIISFQNWIIKNKVNLEEYFDYLSLLKDLQIPVNTKNLAMPKDLTAAHDNAVELLNQMEREISERKYAERSKRLKKLEKDIGQYKFLVPKKANDLIVEGKVLSHCVGGSRYVEGHRNGKLTILFIRTKDRPEEPYYTMEYNKRQIIQIRGKHNRDADDQVWNAAKEWLSQVKGD